MSQSPRESALRNCTTPRRPAPPLDINNLSIPLLFCNDCLHSVFPSPSSPILPTPALPLHRLFSTMPGLVADATRVWELNLYWPLHAQCGVWDPKGKGVDVWECIRPRESLSMSPSCPALASRCLLLQITLPPARRYVALERARFSLLLHPRS